MKPCLIGAVSVRSLTLSKCLLLINFAIATSPGFSAPASCICMRGDRGVCDVSHAGFFRNHEDSTGVRGLFSHGRANPWRRCSIRRQAVQCAELVAVGVAQVGEVELAELALADA